jgi:hypothetical protein
MNPPDGCHFHTRCAYATELCRREDPPLRSLESGHQTACHHAESLPPAQGADEVHAASANTQRRMALYAERRTRIAATAG